MSDRRRSIAYYLSLISPWSYLGGERLRAIVADAGADIELVPVRLMDVYAQTGGVPLAKRAPARKAYRLAELRRWRDHLGIPIVLEPTYFPTDDTMASQLVITAQEAGPHALPLAIAIGRALWELDQDIADPGVLDQACAAAGLAMAELTRHPAFASAAGRYADNTQRAVAAGVFGVPTYIYRDELFWGQDRLDFLARALAA